MGLAWALTWGPLFEKMLKSMVLDKKSQILTRIHEIRFWDYQIAQNFVPNPMEYLPDPKNPKKIEKLDFGCGGGPLGAGYTGPPHSETKSDTLESTS